MGTQLRILRGQVVGVHFEEGGEPQVHFTPWEGEPVTASATREQVRQSLELRERAQALFIMGEKPRLLWIRSDEVKPSSREAQQREDYIFTRWSELLGRLD